MANQHACVEIGFPKVGHHKRSRPGQYFGLSGRQADGKSLQGHHQHCLQTPVKSSPGVVCCRIISYRFKTHRAFHKRDASVYGGQSRSVLFVGSNQLLGSCKFLSRNRDGIFSCNFNGFIDKTVYLVHPSPILTNLLATYITFCTLFMFYHVENGANVKKFRLLTDRFCGFCFLSSMQLI